MKRTVAAHLSLEALAPARLVLSIAVAGGPTASRESVGAAGAAGAADAAGAAADRVELLSVMQGGAEVPVREVTDEHGTRLHLAEVAAGPVEVDYHADLAGPAHPSPGADIDLVRYLRPSRYCESDSLGPTAHAEFAGLEGADLLHGVTSWVGQKLSYVPGARLPTDGAVRTLLARRGVCRDYAHLVVALLRARDVPARLVSVYAPGLAPMDFRAVAEAFVDDAWQVVDATLLAPRQSLVRIATGRDAADTAFLTTIGGGVLLHSMAVSAVVDELPRDDLTELVRLR
ncbi:transglutaminase family protein [Cryobacterium sp. TMT1-21]|uniref:Transglutaminase family protein n=1 Tax=Cryobacterium shii TaxID=1259235 RepID=A0AAQ2HFM5_9MICO|nr:MULTISPECIES: transglutaminase family protein [Cryobacterium]TFC47092.1 transglutaminase family protein [Cryobacterium shii]TFC88197.1 transglutaminase family protein [Cryobacterium sp. TmT2-59]TFD13829.1 transglutaminase family protein [Cryobacterium sp. TMT1-21]TFD16982.1 transglutaminase family protein [Cryobacterium sp. TMT2-23]TFD37946.1 transglutaminase family protein [Cryobacterium sp. TMT2-10]